jgi:hypothetical protein
MDKNDERDQNSLGDRQSDFAGTNPDRYGQPAPGPIPPNGNEAQNLKNDIDTLSPEEAEKARNKAQEGIRQNP